MDFLLDPNIAYLLLVGGLVLSFLAAISPGTGVLEVSALFVFLLAAYSIYNLPLNLWALILLALGGIPFVIAFRKPRPWLPLILSILPIIIGSAFLFRGVNTFPTKGWWIPAVNPFLAAVVSVLAGGFILLTGRKIMAAGRKRPRHDLEALVGLSGEAKTMIHHTGTVQVNGELWSAYSLNPIQNGATIKVVKREGLQLEVEPVE